MSLILKNPHSVLAVLLTRPLDVMEIRTTSQKPGDAWQQVFDQARTAGIPVQTRAPKAEGGRHRDDQKAERAGVCEAVVRERAARNSDELFTDVTAPTKGVWLALDCLQDPHNVGAVFRAASFFGVRGIIMTKDRSAPLTATVYDVAAGGLEYVPFAQPNNLARALDQAKKAGVWVLGTSEHAERDLKDIPNDRPWLIVVGNEESGMRRLTSEHCDDVCRISPLGQTTSLNVSVATGILVHHFSGK